MRNTLLLIIALSALIISGCSSSRRAAKKEKKKHDAAFLYFALNPDSLAKTCAIQFPVQEMDSSYLEFKKGRHTGTTVDTAKKDISAEVKYWIDRYNTANDSGKVAIAELLSHPIFIKAPCPPVEHYDPDTLNSARISIRQSTAKITYLEDDNKKLIADTASKGNSIRIKDGIISDLNGEVTKLHWSLIILIILLVAYFVWKFTRKVSI